MLFLILFKHCSHIRGRKREIEKKKYEQGNRGETKAIKVIAVKRKENVEVWAVYVCHIIIIFFRCCVGLLIAVVAVVVWN